MKMNPVRERIVKDISQHLDTIGRKYLLIVDTKNKRLGYLKNPLLLGKKVDVIFLEDFDDMKIKDTWEYTRVTFDVRYPTELLETLKIVFTDSLDKLFLPE